MAGVFAVVEMAFGAGLGTVKPDVLGGEEGQYVSIEVAGAVFFVQRGEREAGFGRAGIYPGADEAYGRNRAFAFLL